MKALELDDQYEWWGIRDPAVERAFNAACENLSKARGPSAKSLALRNGVEHLKKFEDYGTAIRDLGVRAVTYGMRPADIKSVIGQDFLDPPDAIGDDIVAPPDVTSPAAPAQPRADVEAEDASLLDPPEVSDLRVTTPEERQARRRLVIQSMKADRSHFTRPYQEPAALRIDPPPAPSSLPHDEDDVSSELKPRLGITSQLGAYVLRYPSAIEQLRSNGFRAEYFGCDHAFLRDLFDITRLPADQWNRGLAELQRKYPAEHSRYLRLGEHLPALSSDELAEYFIPLAGLIQPSAAPVETDVEPINSHSILEQESPPSPSAAPLVDEIGGAAPEVAEQEQSPSPPSLDAPFEAARHADALREHWRHELDIAIFHLVRIPSADRPTRLKRFRKAYRRLFDEVGNDPQLRAEIKARFCKLWQRWRRRSLALYPDTLRDRLFAQAEREAESWHRDDERPCAPDQSNGAPLKAVETAPELIECEPLLREAQAKVDALNAGKTPIFTEKEPPSAIEEHVHQVEQALSASSGATSAAVSVEEVKSPAPPLAASAAIKESTPRLQRDLIGHAVTPEDRLIGLIVKHRIPAADVQLRPAHFRDHDLQYTWKRWVRFGSEVDQVDEDAIRARTDRWARFAVWLVDVAAAPDPDNPIDPTGEIATLAELIRGRNEEPAPPPAATDVIEVLPPVPPAAPLEIVEDSPPESPAPAAPTSPAPAGVIIEEEAPPPPTQPVVKMEEQRSVPYVSSARMAEIEAANLEAMLKLASAGVPVFVARLDWNAEAKKWDKQPAIKGWKKAATTDPEIIRRWGRDLPRKLGLPAYRLVPGIWCGNPALDWVVVDADRHGGPDGVLAFNALVAEPGNELPAGPRTLTAGSGVHYVFRQPPGKTKFGNSKGELPGGIDVRGVDGWIVGPGAMRPDGAMWRGADGAPSLIDAFQSKSIPELPNWLACILVAQSERPKEPRKAKPKAEEAKEAKPNGTPPSSDKSTTKRGRAYANGALKKIVEELGAMPPNSGRNEFTYRKAFAMGTMVVRGWIDRRTVESEMYSACERNNLVADKDDVRGAIERGINDGSGCPHDDLPDRRTKAARQRRDSTQAWKNLLPTEIYRLLRVRPDTSEHASIDAAKDVVAAIRRDGPVIDDLDRRQLGDLLRATFKEWKAIGAMFGSHPSRFLPYDASQEEVDAHLAAVRKAKNPDRAKAARERRAREKLEREQQPPPTNDLVAQRCAALVAYAKRHPGKHKTGDLVRGLKRVKAFDGLLTDQVRRNTIVELLRLAVSGKLDAITKFLIVTKETAKNRKPTFTLELRQ